MVIEYGTLSSYAHTLFRFVGAVAHNSELFNERGCKVTNGDKVFAGQLYNFYTEQFERLKENCFNNLNEEEVGKYIRFID